MISNLPLILRDSGLLAAFRRHEKLVSSIVLSLLIVLVWSWVYSRTSLVAWETPLVYEGDAWLDLGLAKAFMDGEIFPVLHKTKLLLYMSHSFGD